MSLTDLDRFKAACAYPGKLDEQAVERELAAFLQALGVSRRVVRLRAEWRDDPPRDRNLKWILAQCAKRDVRLLASLRVAARFHAGQRLRAARDDDAGSYGVASVALDALAARHVSDAGATDAAFDVFDALTYGAFALVAFLFLMGAGSFASLALVVSVLARSLFLFLAAVAALAASFAPVVFVAVNVRRAVLAGATLLAVVACAGAVVLDADPSPTVAVLVVVAVAALVEVAVTRRNAGAAAAARAFDAFAAQSRAALSTNWRGSMWELSWTICVLFDAVDRRKHGVEVCLRPLLEAFVRGCWLLYWANDTLYWVAKPTVRCDPGTRGLRLHHNALAAIESDIVNLYFWHGVMVPPLIIRAPDLITIADIEEESDVEVLRAMIERYRHGEEIHGAAAFIRDAGARRLDRDERYGTLWRRRIFVGVGEGAVEDEPIAMIEMVNRTPEPDGRFKHYWLRVPPTMRTAREAVAWTFPDFSGSTENAAFAKYRQGDVLIIPVESIPEKLDAIDREDGRIVLARGEVNGHAHTVKAEGAALFRDPKLMAVFMRVSGDAPVALEHDDHDTIMIPPGKYQVVRQREYSRGAVRKAYRYVAD